MQKFLYTLFSFFLLIQFSQAQNIVFTESVEYDVVNQRFLISNRDNILARDFEGTLSVFGTTSASHGMEILDNTFFALEGTVVKGIDLTTEVLVMEFTIPSSGFLNGISNDGQSKIYISDFSQQKIYELEVGDLDNPSYTILIEDTQSTPNGLFYDGDNNRLLFLTWGSNASIRAIDLSDLSISTVFTSSFGNFDGIARDSSGNYYISSWSPDQVFVLEEDFTNPTALIIPGVDSPADIAFAKDSCVLGIPMGGELLFFQLEKESAPTSTITAPESGIRLSVYGNPLSNLTEINSEFFFRISVNFHVLFLSVNHLENLPKSKILNLFFFRPLAMLLWFIMNCQHPPMWRFIYLICKVSVFRPCWIASKVRENIG